MASFAAGFFIVALVTTLADIFGEDPRDSSEASPLRDR